MLLFAGELVDVQTGEYNTLVFASTKYDAGLKKQVECSVSIGITDETLQFLSNYKANIGEKIAVGVNPIITKKGKIYYMLLTDILDFNNL